MVFKEDETIIVTIMQLKGDCILTYITVLGIERLLVDSYQIDKSRVEVDVRDKLAGALTKIGFFQNSH